MLSKNVPHVKLLVIGRSGAGKTTLINSFTNLFHDKSYSDERLISITQNFELRDLNGKLIKIKLQSNIKDFALKQSDNEKGQQCSQTEKCNIYTFEREDLILSLIDTPGLGDTRGIKQDKENVAHIVNGVQVLSDFNAICLVHKGSDSRVDDMLKYLIHELKGMLTKECKNNFILCFTGVVNKFKIDALPAINSMGIPTERMVYFENDCLIPPQRLPSRDEDYEEMADRFWISNKKNYLNAIKLAFKMTPQKTKEIKDLHSNKSILIHLVHDECHIVESVNDKKKFNQAQYS